MPQRSHWTRWLVLPALACAGAVGVLATHLAAADAPVAAAGDAPVDFVRDVQPIFAQHCYACHDADKRKGGLQLDVKQRALAGGDEGPILTAGDPEKSKLIHLVRGDDPKEVMPPKGERLTPQQVQVLARWIRQGASWPDGLDKTDAKPQAAHWAFRKPVRVEPPAVKQKDWAKNPVDQFILARLEKEGLAPSKEADRHALIRRLSLDLVGLPPTPDEVKAFVDDTSPDAYEKLVDRLLASPAYGERWARVWLDLARYADSKGHGSDPLRTIWLYRDWVINAFSRNLPYDQFTVEQIAGDLLPNPTQDQLVATAFHRNTMTNDEGGTDDEEFRVVAVKDRANVTAQVWMGLTMGCAQCHTHKYDPITQREYYSFYSFFNQSEDADRPDEQPLLEVWTKEQEEQKSQLRATVAELEGKLKQDTPEMAAGRETWEKAALEQSRQWVVLDPQTFTSTGGATIAEQADQSLLVSGTRPPTDTYTITAHTNLPNITAVRVEVLPDPGLPAMGPGRADNGNFVLNDLKLTVAPLAATPVAGRYVRVELPGRGRILSLAEVEVMTGDQNVARGGKASQSSTAFEGDAGRAIDGNTNGDYNANSVTHTAESDNPYWEVDLGKTSPVDKVVLWNRIGSNLESRLGNFRLVVLDEARKPVWENLVATVPNPSLAVDLKGPQAVALRNASDTFHQDGSDWSADKAIDGSAKPNAGWAVAPQFGRPNAAVFQTDRDIGSADGATLTFTLTQSTPNHSIGKFRLSVITAPRPVRALPASVAEVLTIAPQNRADEHKTELAGFYRSFAPELQPVREQIAQANQQIASIRPATVPVMRELPPQKNRVTNVMLKGNFLAKGEEVKPAFLDAFPPPPKEAPMNRLGVALWLVGNDNPLTARVHVNRLWGQLFGLGLVETQEDFGIMGQPPSHPELLDWLATEFQLTLKWDQKKFLKLLVTSATYRQSSVLRPEIKEKDPLDRLLARHPRRRVEAEVVRDQALALSGLLSKKMLGPSVFPPQPEGLWQAAFNGERTWSTSAGEDRYRRGIYTFWRRTVPYPSMAAFDAPSRETCTVRRIHSNTPLQAFVTLNDPDYVEAAQALARRILKEGGATPEQRARFGIELCQARPATEQQVKYLLELCSKELDHYRTDKAAAEQMATDPLGPLPQGIDPQEAAAWTVVANVLLNLDSVLTKG
jgi:mono/diheme cytochrome c family protein